jgi:uncharacterized membrane protein
MAKPRAFHPLDPRSASTRLVLATAVAVGAWLVVPDQIATRTRILLAWDLAGLVLFGFAFAIIARADSRETRRRAASYDPGRGVVWGMVLGASTFSLFGAMLLVRQPHTGPSFAGELHVVLCVATVAISWLVTHSAFTLRYAHLFYRDADGDHDDDGGIEFPGGEPPDDLDFAYFAFTIGMCFQVSDATISRRQIRRTVLAHAALSFTYNTVILALVLNVVVGQLG